MDKSTKIRLATLITIFVLMVIFGIGLRIYMNKKLENQTGQTFKPCSIAVKENKGITL